MAAPARDAQHPIARLPPPLGGDGTDDPGPENGPRKAGGWPLHVSPWVHYATILAIAAGLVLARRVVWLRDAVVDPYIWHPIVHDQGFNPVNTLLFAVVLVLGVLWWYRLLHHYPIALDWPTIWSGLVIMLCAIVLRVFHDAQLIAPFDADTACVPARGVLMGCAGVFFVTPILWFLAGSLLFPLGRLGIAAQQTAARHGLRAGLAIVVAGPLGIALATALLIGAPWTRAAPELWWVGLAAVAGWTAFAWRARRAGLRWSEAMLMQVLVIAAIIAQPLARIAGGAPHAASLWAVPLAAGLAILVAWQARRVDGRVGHRGDRQPGRGATGQGRRRMGGRSRVALAAFVYLALLQAAAVAAALVALWHGRLGAGLLWLLAAGAGALFVRTWRLGRHPAIAAWATGPSAFIVAGHLLDALATGIGLDLLHATEKHVLPRGLVALLAPALAGTALAAYPATTAMLLYKVPVALFAAWALHVHGRRVLPPDLVLLLQMVLGSVGAGPGLRNVLRQAMGA